MGIIEAAKLAFEYKKYDENGEVEETIRAVDGVNLDVKKGDFVVAGENFGLGSSREHAPQIIKIAGVGAVIAKSFARIFYRNAINIGLLAIECDTDAIDAGDELEVDIQKGIIKNLTNGAVIQIEPIPPVMIRMLNDGGLVEHIKKYGEFKLAD